MVKIAIVSAVLIYGCCFGMAHNGFKPAVYNENVDIKHQGNYENLKIKKQTIKIFESPDGNKNTYRKECAVTIPIRNIDLMSNKATVVNSGGHINKQVTVSNSVIEEHTIDL